MKIVKANATILDKEGITPYQMIEKIGRTCYKSEDSITEDSAVRFVKVLQNNRHWAMLEHYHLIFDLTEFKDKFEVIFGYPSLIKYLNITNTDTMLLVSGSFRAFLELFEQISPYKELDIWYSVESKCAELYPLIFDKPKYKFGTVELDKIVYYSRDDFAKFISGREDEHTLAFKHLTHTILFTCDRGVSHEFVRHRPASFAQESTRYCNYGKGKFGTEITVVKPCFLEEGTMPYRIWKETCEITEKGYFAMLNEGNTPQEARDVLPTSLKTDLIITATEEEWQHIIDLRYKGTTGKPHPQMVEIMTIAYTELVKETEGRISKED